MPTAQKTKIALAAAAVLLLAGGGATVVFSLATSSDTVSVAPAAPAPHPAPSADDAATGEVRTALAQVLDVVSRTDLATSDKDAIVERPEYQPLWDACVEATRQSKLLRQGIVARFGTVPDELCRMMPGGPQAFRQQFVPQAPVQFQGDMAVVPMAPGDFPQAFCFRKADGRWKMLAGATFAPKALGADPEAAASTIAGMAGMLRGMGDAYRQAATDLEAGRLKTVPELAAQMQSTLSKAMQPRQ